MLTVLPLLPRAGEAPKRAIVQFRKDEIGPLRTLNGLVLHEADGSPTREAEAILRHAQPLAL
jgi:tRNA1(Val) A37 N6-methylase TrmN6